MTGFYPSTHANALATPACQACAKPLDPLGLCTIGCGQVAWLPYRVTLCSRKRRFAAFWLEVLLGILTLLVGHLVWSIIVWKNGTSPAKQALGMRVVRIRDRTTARRGTMAIREVCLKSLVGAISGVVYLIFAVFVFSENRQALWDRLLGTIVVNDPEGLLVARGGPGSGQGSV